jgi:predicted ATPase
METIQEKKIYLQLKKSVFNELNSLKQSSRKNRQNSQQVNARNGTGNSSLSAYILKNFLNHRMKTPEKDLRKA